MPVTVTLRYGKGYSGKLGHRPYIARVTGESKQYGLERTFIEASKVEREHFNRPRTMVTLSYDLEPGLYEFSTEGDRYYRMVAPSNKVDTLFNVSEERAKNMIRLMSQGQSFTQARLATRPENNSSSAPTSVTTSGDVKNTDVKKEAGDEPAPKKEEPKPVTLLQAYDPRTPRAEAIDQSRTAKTVTDDYNEWSKARNRVDLRGVDTKRTGRGVVIREVNGKPKKEPKTKPKFQIKRKANGSGKGVDLGADIVRDRRGRHLRL